VATLVSLNVRALQCAASVTAHDAASLGSLAKGMHCCAPQVNKAVRTMRARNVHAPAAVQQGL
jgi:hypothetical protein